GAWLPTAARLRASPDAHRPTPLLFRVSRRDGGEPARGGRRPATPAPRGRRAGRRRAPPVTAASASPEDIVATTAGGDMTAASAISPLRVTNVVVNRPAYIEYSHV